MNNTHDIEAELIEWEQSRYNHGILEKLQFEPTLSLREKHSELIKFNKLGRAYKYVSPITLSMFTKAVRQEIRRRSWYWPIIKCSWNILNGFLIMFTSKYISDHKYFGFKIETSQLPKIGWQKTVYSSIDSLILFSKKHWKWLIPVVISTIIAIINLYIKYLSIKTAK